MLTELLLIAAVGIYDPMDMSGHSMYPSGVKEVDKYPRFAPPPSKLAKFTLPREIIDSNGTIIKSGHYLAGLSISRQEILIFEGEKEIFSVKIDKSTTLERPLRFATAEFQTLTPDEGYIILTENKCRVFAKIKLVK